MNEKHLHIITHDVPWPADFGGVVDLFYKIKTLHQAGVQIYLHCFINKRAPQDALNKYCKTVTYYKRRTGFAGLSWQLPYIVSSRRSPALIANLQKDDYPVLVEGIHCSYYLYTRALQHRTVLLRIPNVEFEYYHHLALLEKNPLKKLYYRVESSLLKRYEQVIAKRVKMAAVSKHDVALFQNDFGANDITFLPVFIPYLEAAGKTGSGCYCLYHGNLSINENEEAAIWLLDNVFNELKVPFVIAGKDPSEKLSFRAHQHPHTCLVANPGDKELHDMIAKAQVNILPSLNNTGVKLKLLNALFNGRHCLVNRAGVAGSGLESVCEQAEDADDFKTAIQYLYEIPFTEAEKLKRDKVLQEVYNNEKNLQQIVDVFWGT